jgi:hypothetical protein
MITLNEYFPIYGVFLLFLGICGNTFMQFFPCDIRNMLQKSTFVRSMFLFFTLFFSVVLSTMQKDQRSLLSYLYDTIIVFFVFIVLTKNPPGLFLLNVFLYFLIYVLFLAKIDYVNSPHYKSIVLVNNILTIIAISFTIFGGVMNFRKKQKTYGKNFNILKFLFKEDKCNESSVFSLKKKINHQ